tara:strand:- start:109 stop:429 length:321 start_codon:yes stop_codon:yes gene_type:complete
MVIGLGEKSPTNFRKESIMDNQYLNLKKIANACDLKLIKISKPERDECDFPYCLFRIGETVHDAVASCNTLDEVTQALCNHILYKTTADVNRGIYLHKEKGIEKYR